MEGACTGFPTVPKIIGSESSDVDETESTVPVPEHNSPSKEMEKSASESEDPKELITKGKYLQEYPSWLVFIGESNRNQYTRNFVGRNDLIWELLSTEQRYLHTLTMIREVYVDGLRSHRALLSAEQADLFPHLDQLITVHASLFSNFLRQHCEREDKVIENLGQCFLRTLTPETIERLVQCYGQLMFVQSSLNDRLTDLRKNPFIAEILTACERDPRTGRRTIADCYLIIVQRWTKVEPLISGVISNTLDEENSTELSDLQTSLQRVQSLLFGAQQFMTDLVQAEKLRSFANNLQEESFVENDNGGKIYLRDVMMAPETKMINYDKLKYLQKKPGEKKPIITEVHAIALTDYFLLLVQDKHTGKYRPFKVNEKPFVVIWSKHFGFFRTSARYSLNFLLIMEKPEAAMHQFTCTTNDEVVRWQKVFTTGFAKYGSKTCVSREQLFEEVEKNLLETSRQQDLVHEKLDLIRKLDEQLIADWTNRNLTFAAYFADGQADTGAQNHTLSRHPSNLSEASSAVVNNSWTTLATSKIESDGVLTSDNQRDSFFSISESESSTGDIGPLHITADMLSSRMEKTYNRFLKHVLLLRQFAAEGASTGLSRSASDATDRQSPAFFTQMSAGDRSDQPKDETSHFSLRKKDSKTKKHGSLRGALFRTGSNSAGRHGLSGRGSQHRTSASYCPISAASMASTDGASGMSRTNSLSSFSSLSSLDLPSLLVSISDCAKKLMEYSSQQSERLKGLETLEASYKTTDASFQKLKAECLASSDDPNEKKPMLACQERESLRIALEKLEKDRAAFQSERQKERLKIERQQQQLIEERRKLDEERRRNEEESETLQRQIDNFYNQTRNTSNTRISGLSTRSLAPSEGSSSTTENADESDSGRTLLAKVAVSPSHSVSASDLLQKTITQQRQRQPVSIQTPPDHAQPLPTGRPGAATSRLRGPSAENGGQGQGEGSRSTVDGATSRPPAPGRTATHTTESRKNATPTTTTTPTALPTQLASKSKSRSNTFKRSLFSPR
ncbi:hypothetical protein AAHC03_0657 [Spirometra sp. Aus1]